MADAATRPNVIVGVTGGIAAYKGLELVRLLAEAGCNVQVLPTLSALRFVGEASFAALSGNRVLTDLWADVQDVQHVRLGRGADVVVVAPATADFLAKAASGMASDLLTGTLLTATCPVVLAPAMHTEMWENPATVANVATLRSRGIVVLEPAEGRLTGSDSGKGRLPDPSSIAVAVLSALRNPAGPDLAGRRVLISAGGTREPIDPVRFIGNRSTGRQGYALAAVAAARGAEVTLVSANSSLTPPAGVTVVPVRTAAELEAEMLRLAPTMAAVVMAAAVADYRPATATSTKLKKGSTDLTAVELVENPDILKALVAQKPMGQVVVGFAAETGDESGTALEHGRAKLSAKGVDLLVVNEVGDGKGFETHDNQGVALAADGSETVLPLASKEDFAETVWHLVKRQWLSTG